MKVKAYPISIEEVVTKKWENNTFFTSQMQFQGKDYNGAPHKKFWTIGVPAEKVLAFSKFVGCDNVEMTIDILLNDKTGRCSFNFDEARA